MAYNSMLNAGRALMAAQGYRANSETHHKTVVKFCAELLGAAHSLLGNFFERSRTRRHDVMYGDVEPGSIGETEARNAISKAKEFLSVVKSKVA